MISAISPISGISNSFQAKQNTKEDKGFADYLNIACDQMRMTCNKRTDCNRLKRNLSCSDCTGYCR